MSYDALMELYRTTDADFDLWLDSQPEDQELLNALVILNGKRNALWEPGHIDSYYRDRYERDARYVRRMRRIKQRLCDAWVASGIVHL